MFGGQNMWNQPTDWIVRLAEAKKTDEASKDLISISFVGCHGVKQQD